jgi:nucleoside-diphosphate-sugar epimerase
VNGEGTANMINAALQAQVKFFCHISSVATLGTPNTQGLIDEDSWWKNEPGQSDYAISKYNAEREVWRGMEEGLAVMVLNPAVILGPGNPNRGSNTLFTTAKKGLKWYTEGSTGYVDARDVAKIVEQLFDHPIRNERFVVSAENIRFREIIDQLLISFGHPVTIRCARPWMLSVAWRLERITQIITGKKPIITKAIAQSAWQNKHYDGRQLTNRLSFTYTPIHQTIADAVLWYKSESLVKP